MKRLTMSDYCGELGIMTVPVSQVQPIGINPKPHGSGPIRRLGMLQNHDVFFSAQSTQAKLTGFLMADKPQSPLELTYTPQTGERYTLFQGILPAPQSDILVLKPMLSESPADIKREVVHNTAAVLEQTMPDLDTDMLEAIQLQLRSNIEQGLVDDEMFADTPEVGQNIFSGNAISSKAIPEQVVVAPREKPRWMVRIESVRGSILPAETGRLYDQIFFRTKLSQAALRSDVPVWVETLAGEEPRFLVQSNPMQAGFQKVERPWQTMFYTGMAKVAAALFGWQITDNQLQLPNGGVIPLLRHMWVDGEGKRHELSRVVRLPNGNWAKLNPMQAESGVPYEEIPFKDKSGIRTVVEEKISQLERAGKVRVLPVETPPPFSPLTMALQPS